MTLLVPPCGSTSALKDTIVDKNKNTSENVTSSSSSSSSTSTSTSPNYLFDTHGRSPTMDSREHYIMLDKRAEKSSSYRNCLAYFMEVAAMSQRYI